MSESGAVFAPLSNARRSEDQMNNVYIVGRTGRLAKVSYAVRRLPELGYGVGRPIGLDDRDARPAPGDLVLCRVTSIGQHKFLGQPGNKRSSLFVGDEIVVAYGARYAPDQFEAEVPGDLGPCHLAAGGGIAGRVVSAHASMAPPTALQPLGLLTDEHGAVITMRGLRRAPVSTRLSRPRTITVLGTSMNGGKTTVVAALVRGLTGAGHRVGAAKITGTGAPGDPALMADSGAACVLDFTDMGFPSTYQLDTDQVIGILRGTIAYLTDERCTAIVIEVADGLLQRETSALIKTEAFRDSTDRIVFAAADSVGAIAGVRLLEDAGLPVSAVSGVVTASPLGMAETVGGVDIPVCRSHDFADAFLATSMLAGPDDPAADRRTGLVLTGAAA